ncbi:hypothetical protein GJ699_01955 [Duganella sp. FT80W]|uniref:Uncharacterized protein n=1 Tax=Duganella guangzhouensis TaxID=2666084 RepID=A0A6I2KSF7_9BURK|nr:hypothetical protein [Duganella guangzhouensis]MRW88745.1 hypothetical protein [Duganella guangzhouensis]
MKDRLWLVLCGCFFAVLAWASWHWLGDTITLAMLLVLILGYAVDNFQLRRQVRGLLAEREQRERKGALQRLMASLLAIRKKKGRD